MSAKKFVLTKVSIWNCSPKTYIIIKVNAVNIKRKLNYFVESREEIFGR